jgi:DNA-binding CsgD family transcriptional regulator
VAVAAGLITATFSALLVHSRRTAFFRFFLANILLFNLLILTGLVFRYTDIQFRERGLEFPPALLLILLAILAVLKLGWLYVFTSMNLALRGPDSPPGFGRRFLALAGPFLILWVGLLFVGLTAGFPALVQVVIGVMEVAVIGGAVAGCVYLILQKRTSPAGTRCRALRVFGGLHLSVFVMMLGSLGLGWLGESGQTPFQVLVNSLVMVVYNLLPLAWMLRFQPLGPITDSGSLERYGITGREREIIELICAGRTNQEIADRLFISLATVKDHNYNIFRKTGVRNRVELTNLFQERGHSGPSL